MTYSYKNQNMFCKFPSSLWYGAAHILPYGINETLSPVILNHLGFVITEHKAQKVLRLAGEFLDIFQCWWNLEKAISSDISGSFSNFFFTFSDRKSLFGWYCSSSSLTYFSAALTKGTICGQLLCASEWRILFQNMLQHVLSTSLLGFRLPLHFLINYIL